MGAEGAGGQQTTLELITYMRDADTIMLWRGQKKLVSYVANYGGRAVITVEPEGAAHPVGYSLELARTVVRNNGVPAVDRSVVETGDITSRKTFTLAVARGTEIILTLVHRGGFFSKPVSVAVEVELQTARGARELKEDLTRALDSLRTYGASYYTYYRDFVESVAKRAELLRDYVDEETANIIEEFMTVLSQVRGNVG